MHIISEEALLSRAKVQNGKIVLPDGMNYRVLVLPDRDVISPLVLEKIKGLVAAGATIVGPKPVRTESLKNYSLNDATTQTGADELWGGKVGSGRLITGKSAREVLLADGVKPDCEFRSATSTDFDYIHRTTGDAEIYFLVNQAKTVRSATVAFRVSGRAPELWDPVTGERKFAASYVEDDGRTIIPLEFAPCGSLFVVFRERSAGHPAKANTNSATLNLVQEIRGPWTVHFEPRWGGPDTARFDSLVSWTTRPEPGIRYYAGTAVYEKILGLAATSRSATAGSRLFLDLGDVHELAEVKVNGKSCGIVWCPPWQVDVTDALKNGENKLQIEVVNFWPNRIIGDAGLPQEHRLTRTNILKLTAQTPLEEAGLLGPVKLLAAEAP